MAHTEGHPAAPSAKGSRDYSPRPRVGRLVRAGPKASPEGAPLDLDGLPDSGGARVICFIEQFCRLPKGGFGATAGAPIRLRGWQRQIIHGIYSADRRPRQGVVSVARKNGKSLLAACLALYHLLADEVESAEVVIVSSDERTAKVIFNLCRRMVELDARLSGVLQTYADKLVTRRRIRCSRRCPVSGPGCRAATRASSSPTSCT